jgi:hypothetical protein
MEWVATAVHGLLTLALVVGVLFSNTRTQHIALLITLVCILFGIRYNKGCFLTWVEEVEEKPTLSELGKAFYLRDCDVDTAVFEEILVANLTFLLLLRIAAYSVLPLNNLF